MTVKVDKACVAPGGPQRIEVVSKPGATIAYLVAYADDDSRGSHGGGFADGEGVFEARLTVPVTAPAGTAEVHVSVNWSGVASSGMTTFTVGCA